VTPEVIAVKVTLVPEHTAPDALDVMLTDCAFVNNALIKNNMVNRVFINFF
jgi:hypothetical protein